MNVVFLTAVNYPDKIPYAEFCIKSWQWWCKKHSVHLFVLQEKDSLSEGLSPDWQRFTAFHALQRQGIAYDRIAVVDVDTIVRWDCPNFFLTAAKKFCAVADDKKPGWVRQSIAGYQHLFPEVRFSRKHYINSGFFIVDDSHRPLFDAVRNFRIKHDAILSEMEQKTVRRGTDQPILNFLIHQQYIPLEHLDYSYNVQHPAPFWHNTGLTIDMVNISSLVNKGYILHFNGLNKPLATRLMGRTWSTIQYHYQPHLLP